MDNALLLSIIITGALIIIILPIVIVICKRAGKKCVCKSKFNNIHIGMSEAELYSEFGSPKQTIQADSSTKVATYCKKEYTLAFLFCIEIEAQVSIKNGVVTNVIVSTRK